MYAAIGGKLDVRCFARSLKKKLHTEGSRIEFCELAERSKAET